MRKYLLSIAVVMVLGISILGLYPMPNSDFYGGKMILMRWCLLAFTGLFVFKNKWLKAYWVWLVFCLIYADNTISAYRSYVIFFELLFFQIIYNKLDKKNAIWILNGICVLGYIQVAWMLAQYYNINFVYILQEHYQAAPRRFLCGVVGQTNSAGALIALCTPAFIRAFIYKDFKWAQWWMLLPVMIYGLWLAQSLMAVTALAGGLIALYWYSVGKYKVLMTLLIALLVYGYVINNDRQYLRSLGERGDKWPRVHEQTLNAPIVGYGLNHFYYIFRAMDFKIYNEMGIRKYGRAHNEYLELVFNQGYVGLLLMLGFLFSNIIKFLRSKKDYLGWIGFTGVIIAMINSGGHFLMHYTVALLPLFYMALMCNRTKGEKICL